MGENASETRLFTFGCGALGELGWDRGEDSRCQAEAIPVNFPSCAPREFEAEVSAVALGTDHSLALVAGRVFRWGLFCHALNGGEHGQAPSGRGGGVVPYPAPMVEWSGSASHGPGGAEAGDGGELPPRPEHPDGSVCALAAGGSNSFMLTTAGEVFIFGQLRPSGGGPGRVQHVWGSPCGGPASRVVQIAAGWRHCLLLTDAGCLFALGDDEHGQCAGAGNGEVALPLPAAQQGAVGVAAGACHSIAWGRLGAAFAWGHGGAGRLGLGGSGHRRMPSQVEALSERGPVVLARCGANFSVFVTSSSSSSSSGSGIRGAEGQVTVWACGGNQYGQLGLGAASLALSAQICLPEVVTFSSSSLAGSLGAMREVAGLECGSNHVLCLTRHAGLERLVAWAWGSAAFGQCGRAAGETQGAKPPQRRWAPEPLADFLAPSPYWPSAVTAGRSHSGVLAARRGSSLSPAAPQRAQAPQPKAMCSSSSAPSLLRHGHRQDLWGYSKLRRDYAGKPAVPSEAEEDCVIDDFCSSLLSSASGSAELRSPFSRSPEMQAQTTANRSPTELLVELGEAALSSEILQKPASWSCSSRNATGVGELGAGLPLDGGGMRPGGRGARLRAGLASSWPWAPWQTSSTPSLPSQAPRRIAERETAGSKGRSWGQGSQQFLSSRGAGFLAGRKLPGQNGLWPETPASWDAPEAPAIPPSRCLSGRSASATGLRWAGGCADRALHSDDPPPRPLRRAPCPWPADDESSRHRWGVACEPPRPEQDRRLGPSRPVFASDEDIGQFGLVSVPQPTWPAAPPAPPVAPPAPPVASASDDRWTGVHDVLNDLGSMIASMAGSRATLPTGALHAGGGLQHTLFTVPSATASYKDSLTLASENCDLRFGQSPGVTSDARSFNFDSDGGGSGRRAAQKSGNHEDSEDTASSHRRSAVAVVRQDPAALGPRRSPVNDGLFLLGPPAPPSLSGGGDASSSASLPSRTADVSTQTVVSGGDLLGAAGGAVPAAEELSPPKGGGRPSPEDDCLGGPKGDDVSRRVTLGVSNDCELTARADGSNLSSSNISSGSSKTDKHRNNSHDTNLMTTASNPHSNSKEEKITRGPSAAKHHQKQQDHSQPHHAKEESQRQQQQQPPQQQQQQEQEQQQPQHKKPKEHPEQPKEPKDHQEPPGKREEQHQHQQQQQQEQNEQQLLNEKDDGALQNAQSPSASRGTRVPSMVSDYEAKISVVKEQPVQEKKARDPLESLMFQIGEPSPSASPSPSPILRQDQEDPDVDGALQPFSIDNSDSESESSNADVPAGHASPAVATGARRTLSFDSDSDGSSTGSDSLVAGPAASRSPVADAGAAGPVRAPTQSTSGAGRGSSSGSSSGADSIEAIEVQSAHLEDFSD
ncbi:unnamed protein product [Polarella glacialis]|uniref:Uncharacterized protein n=1 Tax=Polarella glacialis TaxID=89957 RepID=A0A813GZV5_POLGL|nr:unnamed protein product [Polarella glacialis]